MNSRVMRPSFPLLLNSSTGWIFIPTVDILHIKAEDKYARLTRTDGSSLMLFHSLADLERRLACGKRIGEMLFVRTHRCCIAAMHHAKALPPKSGLLLADGSELPLGRGIRADLFRLMGSVHSTALAVRAGVLLLVGNLLH